MKSEREGDTSPPRSTRRAAPEIIYLGRSHFRRSRANLIQTLHMVNAFEQLGCSTRLYLPARRGCSAAELRRLEEVGVSPDLDVHFTPLLKSRWQFSLFIWFRRKELSRASLVCTRAPEISLALSRAGIEHFLEVHDIAELRAKRQLRALVQYHASGVLRGLFPISHAARNALIGEGADAGRVHVAPSGVDTDAYSSIPPLNAAQLDRPRVVYLGRVSSDRGLEILAALARLGEIDLTLVGDQEERAVGAMRIVPFVPPREVPSWYAQCDLVLLPYQPSLPHAASISPIKLFEAMAAGRPIIASDLPAIREIIRDCENGVLVEPSNIDGWIAAVRLLKTDPAFAQRIAAKARAEAATYSWRSRAEKIVTCLKGGSG